MARAARAAGRAAAVAVSPSDDRSQDSASVLETKVSRSTRGVSLPLWGTITRQQRGFTSTT
ncbi:MAG: hypothetical protein JWL93_1268 [Hyphomicrobiales bacterium]|nr:hypothetical protein [Hyphomicrobiales bacterium]